MARIRNHKQRISGGVRRELAKKYGCAPGQTIEVHCENCGEIGRVEWRMGLTGRGNGQIVLGLEMDHVLPESKGGATNARNLQLLCRSCNRRKGASIQGAA